MRVPDELYVLLPRGEAEAAIAELERHGIHRSEIVVREPEPGRYPLHDERLHEEAAGARRGAELGVGVGAVLGLLVALMVPALRDAGLLGWIVTAFGGAGFGALIGAMTGLQMHEHEDDDPRGFTEVGAGADVQLLEVHCLHFRNKAHRILEKHHEEVAFLEEPSPVA